MELCEDTGKRKYSRKDAGSVVNNKGNRQRSGKVHPARVYFCTSCGAYHLTRNPRRW